MQLILSQPKENIVDLRPQNLIHLLLKCEGGATAIEYGLIAALIAVAAIGAFQVVGSNLSSVFNTVATQL
ncbi:MAG: Flp family type IVb pilin [Alphaproteobacteria bacterium]|nr:Flp family type IVb pilin [Alphaproteobacteria bacterium]